MKTRTMKILGVMLLSVMGSLTALSQAVAKNPAEPPQRPQVGRGGNGAALQEGLNEDLSLPSGWVYVHPSHCELYNGYLYAYTDKGTFWTNNSEFQTLIETDCQFGNYLAFYIYDNSGDWDAVYTYQYK